MTHLRPVQVFTDLKQNNKARGNFQVNSETYTKMNENDIQEAAVLSSLSRQITVSGVGEMVLPPDLFAVTIRCKATKDNIQEAKASVTRRVDYIIQTLKNHGCTEEDFKAYTHAGHQDSHAQFETEIEAHFKDISKCLQLSNLLAEKLGPGVQITLPICYHSQGSLDRLRKQTGMLAIYNARQKAVEMSRVIRMTVGSALKVQEEGCVESQGSPSNEVESFDLNPSIQQRLAEKTVKICNKVNVCFQLKPSKGKKS